MPGTVRRRRCCAAAPMVWCGHRRPGTNWDGTALALAVQPRRVGANCGCCARPRKAGWPMCCHRLPQRQRQEWQSGRAGARRPAHAGGAQTARTQERYRRSFEWFRLDGLAVRAVTGDVAALPCSSAGRTPRRNARRWSVPSDVRRAPRAPVPDNPSSYETDRYSAAIIRSCGTDRHPGRL